MSWLISLITNSTLFKYIAISLIAIFLLVGTYFAGSTHGIRITREAYQAEKIKWEQTVRDNQEQFNNSVKEIVAQYEGNNKQLQEEIDKLRNAHPKTVEKIVRVYISKKADINVPKGFVAMHNTAADGKPLSNVQSKDADESSNVKLSNVGLTVSKNYYTCNAIRYQLLSAQSIIEAYQKQQLEMLNK